MPTILSNFNRPKQASNAVDSFLVHHTMFPGMYVEGTVGASGLILGESL